MKVYLENLGCARNTVDGELMLGRLAGGGFVIVEEPGGADVIIVNTCGFITPAAEESIDTILALAEFKREGACRRLIVTGCLPERYGAEIAAELPEVDIFLGAGAFDRIMEAARGDFPADYRAGVPHPAFPDPDEMDQAFQNGTRLLTTAPVAYVKTAEGCSRQCSYCIIPRLRGRQKSRPAADIIAESRRLAAAGVRELVLVAQDTTDYGRDLGRPGALAGLLPRLGNAAAGVNPDIRIRILYGHPDSITEDMARAMAAHPNICSYYDLPVQHGADAILKAMNRGRNASGLCRLFDRIRKLDPDAILRTTVITGFPGEDEAAFAEMRHFLRDIRFHYLGVFPYSDHEDLPSHSLSHHVPPETAAERRRILMDDQLPVTESWLQKYLDTVLDVLIEEAVEPGVSLGRAWFQAPEVDGIVYVHHRPADQAPPPGAVVKVRITDTLEYDLAGETA